ncbi:hypothetical protein ABS642_06995 [Microbacterium sp. A8/3-1]|uniref:Uncharacterized protein n=1 Tax=Microbacterium sp. A8/3-1 TaxID=3160749 RepID=A0AAU7W1H5_9MICO
MPSKKSREGLFRAADAQKLVRIERRPKHAGRLDGLVVQVGAKWALMARVVDGGYFDGFVAFRVKDVKRVTDDESVAATFAQTLSDWPPVCSDLLDLDSTVGVLNGLGHSGQLLGIQQERERDSLWIGILDEIIGRFVYFHGVRPDATWHPESLGYRLRSITAVEIGRRYFAALSVIAGEGPERDRD